MYRMPNPAPGDLDRRVTLRLWQDQPNAAFGIDQTYDAGVTVWARIEPVGGSVYYGSKQTGEGVSHRITVRHRPGITAGHVAESGGLRYRVRRVSELGGERRFTVLEVEELGAV
jgi:SPP1 family predicted phage head-tail adaptor